MPLFRRRSTAERDPDGPDGSLTSARSRPLSEDLDWRAYDPIASTYSRVLAPRVALPIRDLVSMIEPHPGWVVLDVGTGTGVAARTVAQVEGVRAVGIDVSLGMLREARAGGGPPSYVAGAAIDLPFRDATFDAILATFVLSHFEKYETALFDMLRVLKPGCRLGAAVWGPGDDEFSRAWQEVAEGFAGRRILQDARRRAMPWAERFEDRDALKGALHQVGLRRIVIERREYRFDETAEEYLAAREAAATGRFLREMLGERLWERFRARAREVFAERFPPRFADFRHVNLAVATKP